MPKINQILSGTDYSRLNYLEPMVGGGAVMYETAARFATAKVSDLNPELVNLYKIVKNDVDGLIAELRSGKYTYVHKTDPDTKETYYAIRASRPACPVQQAARMMYLLKTCFNGLMRTNKSGGFNVPMGSYRDPVVCNEPALRACNEFLAKVEVHGPTDCVAFIEQHADADSFLFVDPPYHHPGANNGGKFSDYSGEFGEREQAALISAVLKSGAKFIYTNRATRFIVDQFDRSVAQDLVPLKHSIQPKYTTGADKVEEELVAYRL